MRILAVRGENLASLAEPFEIDLAAEPLAGAGLFAITGETGAGKSTLLDAVCLALYGRFPRIAGAGSNEDLPDVPGETLGAKDARSILRRGAASGFSEVDFVAVDGSVCRARWSVARARGRASGRLQKVSRLLQRLAPDGSIAETLAEQVTAVDGFVTELTDLTFEQFRRTVLLAQGDFDAFLRSDDRERADLLEKITGTEIYARLSSGVFERAKAAREAVERLRLRRAEIGLLAPEARDERTARRDDLQRRRDEQTAAVARAEAEAGRHRAVGEALRQVAEAEVRAAEAVAARAAADADRARLDEIDRARALRPVFDRLRAAQVAEAGAVEAVEEIDRRLAEATPRFERAGEARRAAAAALAVIDERIRALVPQWEAAGQLDVRLDSARTEVADCEAPCRAAAQARALEAGRIAALETRRAEIAGEVGRLVAGLDRLTAFGPLADHWEDVADRLTERAAAGAALAGARARRSTAAGLIAATTDRLARLDREAAALSARRAEAVARLDERRAVLAAIDVVEVRRRSDGLARFAADLEAMGRSIEVLDAARVAAAEAQVVAEGAGTALAGLTARRQETEAALGAARERIAQSTAAVRLADAIASSEAEHLRGALVDGEPCPVCGAREHPIVADPAVRAALDAVRAERAALDARAADLAAGLTALDGRRAAETAKREEAERRGAEAGARVAAAERALAAALAGARQNAAALALAVAEGAEPARFHAALAAAVSTAREATATALGRAGLLDREIEALRGEIEALDGAREAARSARAEDEAARAEARLAEATAGEAEAGALRRLADCDARLAPQLAGLDLAPEDFDRDGVRLTERLAATVAEHRRLASARKRLVEEEQALERDVLALRVAHEHAERAFASATATLEGRRETLARLMLERADMLGGQPTAGHRGAVEAERGRAEAALSQASAELDAARSAHEAALTLHRERHGALSRAQIDTGERTHERDRALAAADLALAVAAGHLALADGEIEALRAGLAALDTGVTSTRAALDERRRDLATAEAAGLPEASLDDLVAEIEALRAAVQAIDQEIGAVAGELAADDAARARAGGLEAEIAEAEGASAVWAAVDEAIGSRDGDKFRKFAQGITLDRLTGLANRHLATLNPRYRLARSEGLGLAIVDRDMGDEVRSTRSLSGGERFLASLALALALSGLEGRRSFVDTLFIDEGFGSLDGATLDVAIDALESLQSEGRKVGVISHVAAMHERIPVQIRVMRAGVGRSRVVVDGGRG